MYRVRVVVRNRLGTAKTSLAVHPRHSVKPSNVTDLNAVATSQTLNLTWRAPIENRLIDYKIVIQPDGDEEFTVSTTETSIFLENLNPHTWYNISVQCIPLLDGARTGYWSGITQKKFRTKENVPAANPALVPGCYQISDIQTSNWEVTLFWKAIPMHLRFGEITKYKITFEPVDDDDRHDIKDVTAARDEYAASRMLRRYLTYKVNIVAFTKIGKNDEILPSHIYIPRDDPDGFGQRTVEFTSVAVEEYQVMFNWTAIPDAAGYTIFYCQSLSNTKVECKEHVEWVQLPANVTGHYLNLTNKYGRYHFAMSLEKLIPQPGHRVRRSVVPAIRVGGGLEWSLCVPDVNTQLKPPSEVAYSEQQSGGSISLAWLRPHCADGFIEQFLINYCISDRCNATMKTVAVSYNTQTYVLKDVEEEETYNVTIQSYSPYSKKISKAATPRQEKIKVLLSGLAKWAIAPIVLAALITAFFLPFGIVYFIRRSRKQVEKKFTVEIDTPKDAVISSQVGSHDLDYTQEADTHLLQQDNSAMNRESENEWNDAAFNSPNDSQEFYARLNPGARHSNGAPGFIMRFTNGCQPSVSLSSTDTLTTPLPSDNSMDADDVFELHKLTGKSRHTSGKGDLMPVAEESSGLSDSGAMRKNNAAENEGDSYYNSIDGYNAIALSPDADVGNTFVQLPNSDYLATGPLVQDWHHPRSSEDDLQNYQYDSERVNDSAVSSIDPYTTIGGDSQRVTADVHHSRDGSDGSTPDHRQMMLDRQSAISNSYQSEPSCSMDDLSRSADDIANYSSLANEGSVPSQVLPTPRDMQYLLQQKPLPVNREKHGDTSIKPKLAGQAMSQPTPLLTSSPSNSLERPPPHKSSASQQSRQPAIGSNAAFRGPTSSALATSGGSVMMNVRKPDIHPVTSCISSLLSPSLNTPAGSYQTHAPSGESVESVPHINVAVTSSDYVEAPVSDSPVHLNPVIMPSSTDVSETNSQATVTPTTSSITPDKCHCQDLTASHASVSPHTGPCHNCEQFPGRLKTDPITGGVGGGVTDSGPSSSLVSDSGGGKAHSDGDYIPRNYVGHEQSSLPSHDPVSPPLSQSATTSPSHASPAGEYVQHPQGGSSPRTPQPADYVANEVPLDECSTSSTPKLSSDAVVKPAPTDNLTAVHRKTDTGRLTGLPGDHANGMGDYVATPNIPQSLQQSAGYIPFDCQDGAAQNSHVGPAQDMNSYCTTDDQGNAVAQPNSIGQTNGRSSGSPGNGRGSCPSDQVSNMSSLPATPHVPSANKSSNSKPSYPSHSTPPSSSSSSSPAASSYLPHSQLASTASNAKKEEESPQHVNGFVEEPYMYPPDSPAEEGKENLVTHPLLPTTKEPNNNCNKARSPLLSSPLLT